MASIKIEKKSYGPNSTPEEIELLRSRVFKYDENTIYWKAAPIMSKFQLDVYFDKMTELSEGLNNIYLIIDLVDAAPPDAKIRRQLSEGFKAFDVVIAKVAVFTEKNFLLNTAAKFVLSRAFGHANVFIEKTLESALKRLKVG
jgi:hypothetical protein